MNEAPRFPSDVRLALRYLYSPVVETHHYATRCTRPSSFSISLRCESQDTEQSWSTSLAFACIAPALAMVRFTLRHSGWMTSDRVHSRLRRQCKVTRATVVARHPQRISNMICLTNE